MNPMDEPKKEEEKKGGGVPIIRLPQKPLLKIKGSGFGTTLIERLKQFKRKDLAFIAAGLSVLILAPVAEHFLMKPETDRGLVPGFATRGGFPVGSPYEPGINGLAPGGLPGQEQDIITPLNARDPSALVLGPGGLTPPAPPPPKTETGMRDALAKSLATGTQEAVKRAGLPSLPPRLAGGFKGFGAGGGGGAGYSPQVAIPKGRGPLPAAGSSLSRVKPIPGMRGFMRGRGPAQGPTPESLKRASQDAGDLFNAPGPASSALDRAAGKGIPGGGDSLGGGTSGPAGEGAEGKFGGATTKEAKSLGETLDFLRRKMEMEKQLELKYKPLEKALDLEWKLKEWDKMYPRRMKEEMYKSLFLGPAGEAMKTLTGEATKRVLDVFAPPSQKSYRCVLGNGQVQTITSGMLNMFGCSVRPASGGLLTCGGKASETRVPEGWVGAQCTPSGGADDGSGKPPPGGPQTPDLPGAQPGQDYAPGGIRPGGKTLEDACAGLERFKSQMTGPTGDVDWNKDVAAIIEKFTAAIGGGVSARNFLKEGQAVCGAKTIAKGDTAQQRYDNAYNLLYQSAGNLNEGLKQVKAGLDQGKTVIGFSKDYKNDKSVFPAIQKILQEQIPSIDTLEQTDLQAALDKKVESIRGELKRVEDGSKDITKTVVGNDGTTEKTALSYLNKADTNLKDGEKERVLGADQIGNSSTELVEAKARLQEGKGVVDRYQGNARYSVAYGQLTEEIWRPANSGQGEVEGQKADAVTVNDQRSGQVRQTDKTNVSSQQAWDVANNKVFENGKDIQFYRNNSEVKLREYEPKLKEAASVAPVVKADLTKDWTTRNTKVQEVLTALETDLGKVGGESTNGIVSVQQGVYSKARGELNALNDKLKLKPTP